MNKKLIYKLVSAIIVLVCNWIVSEIEQKKADDHTLELIRKELGKNE